MRMREWHAGLLRLGSLAALLLAAEGCSKRYVVVGSGAAGSPMAFRLAKAGCRVTLVEKGPDDDWQGEAKPGLPLDLFHPEFSYLLEMLYAPPEIQSVVWSQPVWDKTDAGAFPRNWSAHHHAATSLGAFSEFTHAANVVGGNTVHNLGFWLRGALSQYKMGGRWELSEVLPKLEQIEAMYAARGPGGELLQAKTAGMASSLDDELMELLTKSGFRQVRARDLGETEDKAIAWTEWTISKDGRRLSSGKVFVDPVRELPGFTLLTNAMVSKVRFEGATAVGVTYVDRATGSEKHLDADEVVLAPGALVTPQILLNSGIGPKAALQDLGIPLRADLPVGLDYQGRSKVNVFWCFRGAVLRPPKAGIQFAAYPSMNKTAPSSFLSTQPNMWGAMKTPYATEGLADLAIWVDTNNGLSPVGKRCPSEGDLPVMFMLSAMLVKSKGSVSARSTSMADGLLQHPGFLSHPDDAKTIEYGINVIRETLSSDARFYELMPTAATQREYIYKNAHTFWHDSATAPMGQVVDKELRVMGVKGLRIADTSVHPRICNLAPSAMAHLTGYHGADILLRDAQVSGDRKVDEL